MLRVDVDFFADVDSGGLFLSLLAMEDSGVAKADFFDLHASGVASIVAIFASSSAQVMAILVPEVFDVGVGEEDDDSVLPPEAGLDESTSP
mmetsp:Transcript_14229/g.26939  ORF Transcript_14229/g.26939 Transcript_14229/m.26939 type:complete len:91 (-) Transcript_14229:73-345(-)